MTKNKALRFAAYLLHHIDRVVRHDLVVYKQKHDFLALRDDLTEDMCLLHIMQLMNTKPDNGLLTAENLASGEAPQI